MLVGNMNRRELGHKCVAIPRIEALLTKSGKHKANLVNISETKCFDL